MKRFVVAQMNSNSFFNLETVVSEDYLKAIDTYRKDYNCKDNNVVVIGECYDTPITEEMPIDDIVVTLNDMSKCVGQEIKISTKRQRALSGAVKYIIEKEKGNG